MSQTPVFVTGGTGFVGSHVIRKLLAQGQSVRALVRSTSSPKALHGLDVDQAVGDLRDRDGLAKAMSGCSEVYHVAADYRLWTRNPQELYDSNVSGTINLLKAAHAQKVRRVVYTSTVGALGLSGNGAGATETTPVSIQDMIGHYKRSKFMAEQEAFKLVKAGVPVVVVNPSTPVGSWDLKPTPTGKMIVDFLNGGMPGYVETGLNLIDVEDVATGHLLAMEKGSVGEKYILGNRNMSLREILEVLSQVSGKAVVKRRIPRAVAYSAAMVSTGLAYVTGQPPSIPLEGVRMTRKKMFFNASKAVKELGLPQTTIEEALRKAVTWFQENGYVK